MSETTILLVTILGVNVALTFGLGGFLYWMISKVDSDVKSLNTQITSLGNRMDGHATRIDQLYRMFVDLVSKK